MQWFLARTRDGASDPSGPMTDEQLGEEILMGQVDGSVSLWCSEMPDWLPASKIEAVQKLTEVVRTRPLWRIVVAPHVSTEPASENVSMELLEQGVRSGSFSPDAMVWRPGFAEWERLGDRPEVASVLRDALSSPPPLELKPPPLKRPGPPPLSAAKPSSTPLSQAKDFDDWLDLRGQPHHALACSLSVLFAKSSHASMAEKLVRELTRSIESGDAVLIRAVLERMRIEVVSAAKQADVLLFPGLDREALCRFEVELGSVQSNADLQNRVFYFDDRFAAAGAPSRVAATFKRMTGLAEAEG